MADNMETDLIADAMGMAIDRPPNGLLFHSDRGSQYTSERFVKLVADHRIVQSLSRWGQCRDNAWAKPNGRTKPSVKSGQRQSWISVTSSRQPRRD